MNLGHEFPIKYVNTGNSKCLKVFKNMFWVFLTHSLLDVLYQLILAPITMKMIFILLWLVMYGYHVT